MWVYFLKGKDQVLEIFKEFHYYTTNLSGKHIKILRTDNGGEYCSKAFEVYLKEKGITHQLTVPYNPAQNGVAQRMNRTIVESARSLLFHSNTPTELWAEAVNTAVYLRNRSPTTALDAVTLMNVCLTGNQMLQILEFLDVLHLYMFMMIGERNSKRSPERQYLLETLKAPKNINCMNQILVSSVAEMLYS